MEMKYEACVDWIRLNHDRKYQDTVLCIAIKYFSFLFGHF